MFRQYKKYALNLCAALLVLATSIMASTAPAFARLDPGGGTVKITPTPIDLMVYSDGGNYSCQGSYGSTPGPESSFLGAAGYPTSKDDLNTDGYAPDPDYTYLNQHFSDPVTPITFAAAAGTPVNDGGKPFSTEYCKNLVLIPTSSTTWKAKLKYKNPNPYNLPTQIVSFTVDNPASNIGTLTYALSQPCGGNSCATITDGNTQTHFEVGGNAPGAGTTTTGNAMKATFIDASTIKITDGSYKGEIYKKDIWNNKPYYFLYSTPNNDADGRDSLVLGTQSKQCDTPYPKGSENNCSVSQNCVPFFWETTKTFGLLHEDVDNKSFGRLQGAINSLQNADWTYHDYTTACATPNGPKGVPAAIQFGDEPVISASEVWFYYSQKANNGQGAFAMVFPQGDSGNDGDSAQTSIYTDIYNPKAGTYEGGGSGSCSGKVDLDPSGNWKNNLKPDESFQISWELWSSDCQTKYGTVQVEAVADESDFNALANYVPPSSVSLNANAAAPKLSCDVEFYNPLSWFICPLVAGLQGLIGQLDDAINNELSINSNKIFNTNTDTGKGYFQAWETFRIFALGLIVIAALIAIIAHASGIEVLDAYTIRKVLPRVIFAVIGISLSWYLMKWLVDFTNDVGNGVRALIYAPFDHINGGKINLGGGSTFSLGLVGGAAAIFLGLPGLLCLVATGALAVMIGFGVLIIRRLIILVLIIIAPLAIALSILPNTKKAWDLWNDTFVKLLLMFPIVMAFIAMGRVFAVTSDQGGTGSTVDQLVAFVAYFAPYFLITFAFRLAGGAVATIGGLANDRSRGAFDRLRKTRQGIMANRYGRAKSGTLWDKNSRMTKALKGNDIASWVAAPHKALAHGVRHADIPILSRYGRRLQGGIHEDTVKQSDQLRGKMNDIFQQNDKAYRATAGLWSGLSMGSQRRLIERGMAQGDVDEHGNVSNLRIADRYKNGLQSEDDYSNMSAVLSESNDTTEQLAATKLLSLRDEIPNLYHDGEMAYADVQGAAVMGLASHGFASNDDLADAGNMIAARSGMEVADSLVGRAQLLGATQGGRIDNKPGYGLAIRDGKFVNGIKDFEDGGGGRDMDILQTFTTTDVANAKGGAFKALTPTYDEILTNGRTVQAQATWENIYGKDENGNDRMSKAERENLKNTKEGRQQLRAAAAYENYDAALGQVGLWASDGGYANMGNRTEAKKLLDKHVERMSPEEKTNLEKLKAEQLSLMHARALQEQAARGGAPPSPGPGGASPIGGGGLPPAGLAH